MRRSRGKRKAEATKLPRMSRRRKEEEEDAVQEARRRTAPSVREFKYNKKRVRLVSQGSDLKENARCILYWMFRDQRVQGGNQLAEKRGKRSSHGWRKRWLLPTVALGAGAPLCWGGTTGGGERLLLGNSTSFPAAEHPPDTALGAFSPDNWAFLYAQRLALKQELPLRVCFCLVPKFLDATIRHYDFMLKGLQEMTEVQLLRGCPRWVGQGSQGREEVDPSFQQMMMGWGLQRCRPSHSPFPLPAGVCGAEHPLPLAAGLPQGCAACVRGGAWCGWAGDRLQPPPPPPTVGGGHQGAVARGCAICTGGRPHSGRGKLWLVRQGRTLSPVFHACRGTLERPEQGLFTSLAHVLCVFASQVDAHNIVPCWVASPKQEYSAWTFRCKINAQLPEFLTEFPPVICHPYPPSCPAEVPTKDIFTPP